MARSAGNCEDVFRFLGDPNLDINFPINKNNLTFPIWAIRMGDLEFIQTIFGRKDINFEV
jgi:hypothetical protein